MDENWKFHDPPNVACFTSSFVLVGSPILRVCHDYDADWQFHGSPDQPVDESVARVVALSEIVGCDSSVMELYDLPYGWAAERTKPGEPWRRFRNHPFPTFDEDGFYLEDAVWLSQSLPDISPPSEEVRDSLSVGQHVKLVFRFAAEHADRADNECERMWVEVVGCDDDYMGRIANDPLHDAAKCGDEICFHPLHVAEVLADEPS